MNEFTYIYLCQNIKMFDIKLNWGIICAGCMTFLFLLIFLTRTGDSYKPEKAISGFWVVSEEFKDKANIDQMIIYFDKGDGYIYKGYLVLTVDNDTVFNNTLNFRITPKGYFKNGYTIEMEKKVEHIPQKLTMTLDPYEGLMEMKCLRDGKIYAKLFKDNQMSAKTILSVDEPNDGEGIGESNEGSEII